MLNNGCKRERRDLHGRDRMVVGFTTTCAISTQATIKNISVCPNLTHRCQVWVGTKKQVGNFFFLNKVCKTFVVVFQKRHLIRFKIYSTNMTRNNYAESKFMFCQFLIGFRLSLTQRQDKISTSSSGHCPVEFLLQHNNNTNLAFQRQKHIVRPFNW